MDATLRYVNSRGEEIIFAPGSNFHYSGGNIRDYSHGYKVLNSKVAGFTNEVEEFTVNAVVNGTLEDKNKLYEVLDFDVLSKQKGKFYAGDWYIECYCVGSSKDEWFWLDGYMRAELSFVAEGIVWSREHRTDYALGSSKDGLDYSHDFAYDFTSTKSANILENTAFVPSFAIIDIYGPAVNPTVVINGNEYKVEVTVPTGSRLEIDGLRKTIFLVSNIGERTNVFSKRSGNQQVGSGQYVFEKVDAGRVPIVWENIDNMSVTLVDQRAEPRWA